MNVANITEILLVLENIFKNFWKHFGEIFK